MQLFSFAQNLEDVMLWRALGDIKDGFYIDVGAADPIIDSVTKLFYDHGWNGINIEPDSKHLQNLMMNRARDINLQIGIASEPGDKILLAIAGSGLSTFVNDLAETHQQNGLPVSATPVACRTLVEVCETYRPTGPIHFLKVDAEGSETDVLRSADFQKFRPWVVLVEATKPNTQIPDWDNWEPDLLRDGYKFAWYDGLNRFYVAEEKSEILLHHFTLPPNVFDNFYSASELLRREQSSVVYAENEKNTRLRVAAALSEALARYDEANDYAKNERDARLAAEDYARSERDAKLAAENYASSERDARLRAEAAHAVEMTNLEEYARQRYGEAEHRALGMQIENRQLQTRVKQTLSDVSKLTDALETCQERLDHTRASETLKQERLDQTYLELQMAWTQLEIVRSEAKDHARLIEASNAKLRIDMTAKITSLTCRCEELMNLGEQYQKSTSWRITRPLRVMTRRLRVITRLLRVITRPRRVIIRLFRDRMRS